MASNATDRLNAFPKGWFTPAWFWLPAIILVALRFTHFGEMIDGPHEWRQADTGQYAWSLYKGEGDIFHPQVAWMGGHKQTILEFPLHEAITAVLYRIFWPGHVWARLVTLLFFLGSAVYLFRIIRLVSSTDHARMACLIYLAMPLGLFYSRALHVDFTAVCLAHGMLYHWMMAVRTQKQLHWLLGFLFATLAFPVKAPYAFYLALPLLAWILHEKKFMYTLRNLHWTLTPLLLFGLWQWHVERTNAAVPDWNPVLPDFHPFSGKFTKGWYFGTLQQRLAEPNWFKIWIRLREEVTGGRVLFFIVSAAALLRPGRFANNFFRLWLLGTLVYLLIFFNLNMVHNYYQIPFLSITAILLGGLLCEIRELLDGFRAHVGLVTAVVLLLALGVRHVNYAENHYYETNLMFPRVGQHVQKATEDDALVIISYPHLDCRAPHFLYASRRYGWQVKTIYLNPPLINRLMADGADYLVAVEEAPLDEELKQYLARCPRKNIGISGKVGMQIFDLNPLKAD